MRQSKYKRFYDPEIGRCVKKKHIYGKGIFDSVKSIRSKLFGETPKKMLLQLLPKQSLKQASMLYNSRRQNNPTFTKKEKKTKRLKCHQSQLQRQKPNH